MKSLALALAFALVPFAAALPGACADPCEIAGDGTFGYNPAVAPIASGSSVVWTAEDYGHLTVDGRGFLDGSEFCFEVWHSPEEPSPAVQFDLTDGVLYATTAGVTEACASAVATPAGAALPYFCALHPTMHGVLVVTA